MSDSVLRNTENGGHPTDQVSVVFNLQKKSAFTPAHPRGSWPIVPLVSAARSH